MTDLALDFYEALMTDTGVAASVLDAIVRRPAWMAQAACIGRDDIDWFAVDVPPEAADLCRTCPVLNTCTSHGFKHREVGIWGGMTERARTGERYGHLVPISGKRRARTAG